MRRLGGLLAVTALLACAAPAVAAPEPPFGHAGRWITDAEGRVVILHGLNMINKFAPYHPQALGFGVDDADFLAAQGFNTIRIGPIYKGLEPTPGAYDDAYLQRLVALKDLVALRGLFPLVDFHQDMFNERFNGEGFPDWAVQDDGLPAAPDVGFPGNYLVMPALQRAFDHFWANDPGPGGVGLQDRYAAAWRHVVRRLRADTRIVGFDIFNEPFAGTAYPGCANPAGCEGFDATLTAFSKRIFGAIRQEDSSHLLFYEPNLFFNSGAATRHGDTGDPRAGMSFHVYCLGATPGLPRAPEVGGCDVGEPLPFDDAERQSRETGDALLLTEFGATDELPDIQRIVDRADRSMVGWQEWAYWNRDVCCARPAEGVIRDIARPPTGDNVKASKLDVLVRAYPQVVAGTPRGFFFDAKTRVFTLEYRTAKPGGGVAPAGAESDVFVPRRHYPGGYDVVVSGARVASPIDAEHLRLLSEPGASEVRLRVTPAGRPQGLRPDGPAPGRRRCLGRSAAAFNGGIGRLRLGQVRGRIARLAGSAAIRERFAHRYCVAGGGQFVAVFPGVRGGARLVASTAPGHRARGIGRGATLRALRRAFPGLRLVRPGVVLTTRRRDPRLLFGVARGRVTFVAAATPALRRSPALLRVYLRRAGLGR